MIRTDRDLLGADALRVRRELDLTLVFTARPERSRRVPGYLLCRPCGARIGHRKVLRERQYPHVSQERRDPFDFAQGRLWGTRRATDKPITIRARFPFDSFRFASVAQGRLSLGW